MLHQEKSGNPGQGSFAHQKNLIFARVLHEWQIIKTRTKSFRFFLEKNARLFFSG
jgi:hypothetical protein